MKPGLDQFLCPHCGRRIQVVIPDAKDDRDASRGAPAAIRAQFNERPDRPVEDE